MLAQGAEAVLTRQGGVVLKNRIKKNYRIKKLDDKLRVKRTKREARILREAKRSGVKVPRVLEKKKTILKIEYLDGSKIKGILDEKPQSNIDSIMENIGRSIARLHKVDIIHGDLTTSNMILVNRDVYFIDFGLSFHSKGWEHKAVDLHLFHRSLISAHRAPEDKWGKVLKVYKNEYAKGSKVIKRLRRIEKRGRYVKKD